MARADRSGRCAKTALGELVAHHTRRAFVDIDAVAEPYCAEVGWSLDKLRDRIAIVGRVAAETEWEPARAHAVTRTVDDHPDAVVALGAGHTSYTSLAVLRERCLATKGHPWIVDGHDFLAAWLDDPGPRQPNPAHRRRLPRPDRRPASGARHSRCSPPGAARALGLTPSPK
jgi:hypothetical protein